MFQNMQKLYFYIVYTLNIHRFHRYFMFILYHFQMQITLISKTMHIINVICPGWPKYLDLASNSFQGCFIEVNSKLESLITIKILNSINLILDKLFKNLQTLNVSMSSNLSLNICKPLSNFVGSINFEFL